MYRHFRFNMIDENGDVYYTQPKWYSDEQAAKQLGTLQHAPLVLAVTAERWSRALSRFVEADVPVDWDVTHPPGVKDAPPPPGGRPGVEAPPLPALSEQLYASITFLRVERWNGARWRTYLEKIGPVSEVNRAATPYLNAWFPPYYWISIWDLQLDESGGSRWELTASEGNSAWEKGGGSL